MNDDTTNKPTVAVCALTYKRPDGLRRLLTGLAAQDVATTRVRPRFVIVDNDPEASGRSACEAARASLPGDLAYVVEPRKGIAHGRNAALDAAVGSEWIVFIDDDEVPARDWLAALFHVQREYEADVVTGPVLPDLPAETPAVIRDGGFFDRQVRPTGTRLRHAFTNNVLLRAALVEALGLRFDTRWALVGCEDRHFFQQIGMAGFRIVWADEAQVTETIPATRANSRWVVRRHYRVGNAASLVEIDLRGRHRVLVQVAKAAAWTAIGGARAALGLVGGRLALLRGCCAGAYAAGLITGCFGFKYEEYR